MNYWEIIITFFNTLNTELLHETISRVSLETPESEDSDTYIIKRPVALFTRVKDKNSPSCTSADEYLKCGTQMGRSIMWL